MPLPLARSCRLQQSWLDPTACHGAATVRAQRALISRRIHWPATLEYLSLRLTHSKATAARIEKGATLVMYGTLSGWKHALLAVVSIFPSCIG